MPRWGKVRISGTTVADEVGRDRRDGAPYFMLVASSTASFFGLALLGVLSPLRMRCSAVAKASMVLGDSQNRLHAAMLCILLLMPGIAACSKTEPITDDRVKPSPRIRGETPSVFSKQAAVISVSPEPLHVQIPQLIKVEAYDNARAQLRNLLVADPQNWEAQYWWARVEEADGRLESAVALASEIPVEDPQFGLMSLGMAADLLIRMERYDEGLQRYLQIAKAAPSVALVRRQLASLLNRLGRRQEAIEHLRVLCRLGDITQTELASMLSRQDASITAGAQTGKSLQAQDASDWFGSAAIARDLISRGDPTAALQVLRQACSLEPQARAESHSRGNRLNPTVSPAAVALLGRVAVDLGDDDSLNHWAKLVDSDQRSQADHWYALGVLAIRDGFPPETSAGFLIEAVWQDPTDWVAYGLLENLMNQLGNEQAERSFHHCVLMIKRSIIAANQISEVPADSEDVFERLALSLEQLQRPLEANAWRTLAAYHLSDKRKSLEQLQKRYLELAGSKAAFASSDFVLGSLKRDPNIQQHRGDLLKTLRTSRSQLDSVKSAFGQPIQDNATRQSDSPDVALRWHRAAKSSGIDFRYHNAAQPKMQDFQIYEQFGGGVAALDYDRNGAIDFYFAQSAGTPLQNNGGLPNRLFAQRSQQYSDVTLSAEVDDRGYGLGVAVGDLNQDGFDDLIVCNFGPNTVLINQGDGTFQKVSLGDRWDAESWTCSIAVADIDGDQLPDVVEVNYLDDPNVFEVPALDSGGRYLTFLGPESYRPAIDRILYQQFDQTWVAEELTGAEDAEPGLGVVVADFDGEPGNEIFVANDMRPNQFWQREKEEMVDVAKLQGCAYSGRGGSSASMGIASGDFDGNGKLDLHVTNFYNEPVHLYLQQENHSFVDAVVPANLETESTPVLGFGTAAIDFENDGDLDLAVVNGHIEDLRFRNAPFKMKSQLFSQRDRRFEQRGVSDSDEGEDYFSTPVLGRGLIRTDWNRDGRVDLLATHLDCPAELLENQTQSSGNWLQLQLVGVDCERNAIGASVTVQTELGKKVEWLESGCGYSCSDERVLFFGLGDSRSIQAVSVRWPDGSVQELAACPLNQRALLVQGQSVFVVD